MKKEALPDGGTRYSTERGTLDLWVSAPIVALRINGTGEAEFATPIAAGFDQLRLGERPVQLFFEMQGMPSYESGLRTELTAHFLKHRARVGALHVFTQSKLVAMGVSVANLALNGIITSHSKREQFTAAFTAAIAQTGAKLKSTVFSS